MVINGRYSAWTDVSSGVPQGSVLGPNIFLVFIIYLEDGVQIGVLKFADDNTLNTEVTKEGGGEQLREDLDSCTEWANNGWGSSTWQSARYYMQEEQTQ